MNMAWSWLGPMMRAQAARVADALSYLRSYVPDNLQRFTFLVSPLSGLVHVRGDLLHLASTVSKCMHLKTS